ncbi:MAG: nucleotide pyrophosphohydrolase [Nitrososphaerota archaeon]|nr:nucleotide pyrophosphohydrolase [Nitrososphaerota archaeon]
MRVEPTFLVLERIGPALDEKTTVSTLKGEVSRFRDDRDWLEFHNPKDLSIALSIESSELEELFLWKDAEHVKKMPKDKEQLQRIKEEMADIGIYLLSLANVLGVDLSDGVAEKLAKNSKKYPIDKSKGSNKKYDEL